MQEFWASVGSPGEVEENAIARAIECVETAREIVVGRDEGNEDAKDVRFRAGRECDEALFEAAETTRAPRLCRSHRAHPRTRPRASRRDRARPRCGPDSAPRARRVACESRDPVARRARARRPNRRRRACERGAQASGLPAYVPPSPPGSTASTIDARPTTPASGRPPAMLFANVIKSGATPACSIANIVPVRPKPV